MELKQQIRIAAPRAQVFAALNDPALLKLAIPGCEALNETAPGRFEAIVAAKVGPLSARFNGSMQVQDLNPPESYALVGEGRAGPAGHAKVRASVPLPKWVANWASWAALLSIARRRKWRGNFSSASSR